MAAAKTILLALAIGYVAIGLLLWLAQERIMFHPVPVAAPAAAPSGWRTQGVSFRARDGISLSGILVMPPRERVPLVIYYGGNAEGSTLRRTLGCLLAEQLGIELRRVGSGRRFTFLRGEQALSGWMAQNALRFGFLQRTSGSDGRRGDCHFHPILVHTFPAFEDATAASMKRMPAKPSCTVG